MSGSLSADLETIVTGVTKKWTKQRKAEERDSRARFRRPSMYSGRVNFTDVASEILPAAYAKASGGGTLPVANRQLFYAARGPFQEKTGREIEYGYFAQNLLRKYLQRPEAASWKVTADPRGTLIEPHTGIRVPVGTLEIDSYLEGGWGQDRRDLQLDQGCPTRGPRDRYRAILYIEKEGFNELARAVRLAERYDLAILSCKGQSVVAARKLVDRLCGGGGIPLFVLHDFDKYGFSIFQNLVSVSCAAEDGERVAYVFKNEIQAVDLGLRLLDVEEWKLKPERCRFTGDFDLYDDNVTDAEKAFLRKGQRVELNAFTSPDFVAFVEKKLKVAGIREKLVPDNKTLGDAYRRAHAIAEINGLVKAAPTRAAGLTLPRTLRAALKKSLKEHPEKPWDAALYEIALKVRRRCAP